MIAAAELPGVAVGDGLGDLALTLLAGAAVNVYIVGLNQCEDVEIDRINKPGLPIAAGRLSLRTAWRIVAVRAAGARDGVEPGLGRDRGGGKRRWRSAPPTPPRPCG